MSPRERIEEAIVPLLQQGFTVEKVDERPQVFGNTIMVLSSPQYGVKITSDRGDVYVHVLDPKEPAERWYDLSRILAVEGLRAKPGSWKRAQSAIGDLLQHEAVVKRVLAEPKDRSRIKQMWPY